MQPFDPEVMFAFLRPQAVANISDTLLRSSDSDARMVGRYVNDNVPHGYFEDAGISLPIELAAAAAPEARDVLDVAIRDATKGGKTIPTRTFSEQFQNTKNWGLALLQEYFVELRQKICGKGKKPAALGQSTNSALSALAASICKLLGLSNALGTGIAVLLILNAARIGKNALCKMTSPDELTKYFA